MKEILLIGGGGHCKSVIDVVEQEGRFKIAGIIDKPDLLGKKTLNYTIIGNDNDLQKLSHKYQYAFISVGQIRSSELRAKLFTLVKKAGFSIPIIISPRAYVSQYATLDEGTIVMHDALINASVKIGKNCIINTKSIVEHDVIIEDNCHISTSTIVNGSVHIGQGTFIGSNSTTKEDIMIQENSFIKAGSVVK